MNYQFTDRVRAALGMAREEAVRLGSRAVTPGHLLLSVLREGGGVGVTVLRNLTGDLDGLGARLEASLRGRVEGDRARGKVEYSLKGKRALEQAMAEARRRGHTHVGTEHLVLGVLASRSRSTTGLLEELGVTLEGARAEVERLLGARRPSEAADRPGGGGWLGRLLAEAETPAEPGLRLTIDDDSAASIYEQIIAQVQEAVATGRLSPGSRLPTVRQLADQLDIAPGTVARAYGELERLGVIVTEGARGTRVADHPKRSVPEPERPEMLAGLLRPVVVAAYHLGASARELRSALEQAMRGIFDDSGPAEP